MVCIEFDVYFSKILHASGPHSEDILAMDGRSTAAMADVFAFYFAFVDYLPWWDQYFNLLETRYRPNRRPIIFELDSNEKYKSTLHIYVEEKNTKKSWKAEAPEPLWQVLK